MRKKFASSLAAAGMAAVMVLPATYAVQARSHREYRAERPVLSAGQSIDRADARIADLKADLLLSPDQAKNWPALETALHDIAVKRAKNVSSERDLQSGNAPSQPSAGRSIAEDDEDTEARAERVARGVATDDLVGMRREADALAMRSANLRQIADAAKPLYDTLDERQRRRFVQFVRDDLRAGDMDELRGRRR